MKQTKVKSRSLIRLGNRNTLVVSIPKAFIDKHGLKAKDKIGVVYDDVLLICTPQMPKEKE